VEPTTSERGCGAPVDTDDISSALEPGRLLRLALNVLWDGLPNDMSAEGPVRDAMQTIHNRINKIEADGLRARGLAEHYLIVRPVSLVNSPPLKIMEKITTAVRTLAELGMLAGQNDASYREYD
jgi:hypothetical protein